LLLPKEKGGHNSLTNDYFSMDENLCKYDQSSRYVDRTSCEGGQRPGALRPGATTEEGGRRRTLRGLGVLLVVLLLGGSVWLRPDPEGYGTHSQLSLPACSFESTFGVPGPACGMTTAFAHQADGHFVRAFRAQPLAFVLFWVLMASGGLALLNSYVNLPVLTRVASRMHLRHLYLVLVFWILSWVYKLHVFAGTF